MNEIVKANDKLIDNLTYFEPTLSLLFTYRKYILELSYYINDNKDGISFLLFDKINKNMYESVIIKPEFFDKELKAFENFEVYFKNVFCRKNSFKIEYFKENEVQIIFNEFNSFDKIIKSYTIYLFITDEVDYNIKRENDIEIESELRELVNDMNENNETPKDIDDKRETKIIENLTNEIKELKSKNEELSLKLNILQRVNDINEKYCHVQGTIKYCKGINKGCLCTSFKLFGSNPYLLDKNNSNIFCQAALHNGSISDNGGFYVVKLSGLHNNFTGSLNNNIRSFDHLNASNSFTIHSVDKLLFNGKFDICGNINI